MNAFHQPTTPRKHKSAQSTKTYIIQNNLLTNVVRKLVGEQKIVLEPNETKEKKHTTPTLYCVPDNSTTANLSFSVTFSGSFSLV